MCVIVATDFGPPCLLALRFAVVNPCGFAVLRGAQVPKPVQKAGTRGGSSGASVFK